ncbi:MAG: RNA polymerase sigma factor [Acidobacteriia bacterium]|nr:RNA polymerase sigma factor [Terriglobia bacterium]
MVPTSGDGALNFEELVTVYYRPLYQFAYSLSHDEAEASDLTQQTFYIWARKGRALRDPSKVKTWLFTTLHREFLRIRRHASRFPHRTIDEAAEDLPSLSPTAVERLDAGTVLEALATLEEIYRAPLALFYLREHSYVEIAEILALPIGTVQSRISRGKAQLRERLARGDSNSKEARKVQGG